jgi:hypothetical protein
MDPLLQVFALYHAFALRRALTLLSRYEGTIAAQHNSSKQNKLRQIVYPTGSFANRPQAITVDPY